MQDKDIISISQWLSDQGLKGTTVNALVAEFCRRCNAAGLPISYALVLIDTLHPDFEGNALEWDATEPDADRLTSYQFTSEGHAKETWEASIFYHMLTSGESERRLAFAKGEPADFFRLDILRDQGHSDYVALLHRFTQSGSIGQMDCLFSHWTTRRPEGFSDEDLRDLRILLPTLALAVKSVSTLSIIRTLANVYLGRDAGDKVVNGQIIRGAVESIDAVIWYSDLKNFTSISDQAEPSQIIPFLNDYAGLILDAIHRHGGSVLKLMGDGVLAIFTAADMADACDFAMNAGADMRHELGILNGKREAGGEPTTGIYLGLHVGRVFYGNIGSRDRLDFTVVGPAVNEASRIAALCRSIGHDTLLSDDFAAACVAHRREKLAALGEFSLRGVEEPKRLFTVAKPAGSA
jgi:adenylate cyclase